MIQKENNDAQKNYDCISFLPDMLVRLQIGPQNYDKPKRKIISILDMMTKEASTKTKKYNAEMQMAHREIFNQTGLGFILYWFP